MQKIPVPYGFRVSVEIVRDEKSGIKKVLVHCPIYVKKTWEMPQSYSTQYLDKEILNDSHFHWVLSRAFGKRTEQ
jgi:hypothetical protein